MTKQVKYLEVAKAFYAGYGSVEENGHLGLNPAAASKGLLEAMRVAGVKGDWEETK